MVQRFGPDLWTSGISLAEFDGHPAIAYYESYEYVITYCEAADESGFYWETPVTVAPELDADFCLNMTPLFNLGGFAAVGIAFQQTTPTKAQLRVYRYYR